MKEDAGRLLAFIHQKHVEDEERLITYGELIEETKWDNKRLRRILTYLSKKGFIKCFKSGIKLDLEGMNIIENEPRFKTTFGFSIKLGIVNFNWSREKRA